MASLSLQHINKTYPNGFQAVKDFNLEIEDKEFIIFVGPSGCGKSTTLRMIAGLEEISGGTLKIGDKVMNDVEPKDRDIAMVFQNYALYPHMMVPTESGVERLQPTRPTARARAQTSAMNFFFISVLLVKFIFCRCFLPAGQQGCRPSP